MTLSDLNLCDSASGNVTALELELSGQRFLCHFRRFPQRSNVLPNLLFDPLIHRMSSYLH